MVTNLALKRSIDDYSKRMKPILKALDKTQQSQCKINDAVDIWKELSDTLRQSQSNDVIEKVNRWMNQVLTPHHFLANMVDPRYLGSRLSEADVRAAMTLLTNEYPLSCKATVVNLILR